MKDDELLLLWGVKYAKMVGIRKYELICINYLDKQVLRMSDEFKDELIRYLEQPWTQSGDSVSRREWSKLLAKLKNSCYGCMGACFGDCVNCKRGKTNEQSREEETR